MVHKLLVGNNICNVMIELISIILTNFSSYKLTREILSNAIEK